MEVIPSYPPLLKGGGGFGGLIDAVAVGEADYTLKELAQKLSQADLHAVQSDAAYRNNILSSVDGIAYRVDSSVHVNKRRELITNLDELPFVSRMYKKHLDATKYFFAASDYPEVQIMTARGCIAQCTSAFIHRQFMDSNTVCVPRRVLPMNSSG